MQRLAGKRSLRLEPELDAELESVAAADRRNVSYIIRVAVEEYLERRRTPSRRRAVRAGGTTEER